ncbi:SDA1-domain-containing protein [Truncatella angustata]|uniref:Protein SDA1 n=1 Tax=Truncatella angustata TaxID=152316 RepID=A0A9P8UR15_9PEZI|nr:SDA1-domain-containing protein [Truncatella angustata]KAH6656626.1 SDA1-domain-containing protein [Truncatella angustata]KAH8194533.1 hypothetical protein TruAng_011296 [Truncatella angustata]
MARRKVTALEKVEADLAGLQYRIRRDPAAYEAEFLEHLRQYETSLDRFNFAPLSSDSGALVSFREQIDFLSHVAELYPTQTAAFPDQLKDILVKHHAILESELREKVVSSLVLLRRKEVIDSSYLLMTLIPLLTTTPSKTLRTLLFTKITSDLRNANSKHTNHKLNRIIQTALYTLVTSDRASPKSLWAVKLTREMWKRQLWTDAKPVDIMREACLSDNEKVVIGAVRFFLGSDQEREENQEDDESDGDNNVDIRKVKHQIGINKKTKKKTKALEKAVDKVKRQERKKHAPTALNFSALNLLHDPQGFAEILFQKHLQSAKARFSLESRLLVLQLVTRLVGQHKLTIIELYSWFIKYLTPKQQSATSFLADLAQAIHDHIPPDVIEPLIEKIATEFVSEAAAAEVCAAGLNAIRHICVGQPLAMQDTLLQDLVQYRRSKDKAVSMAARGLLSLYREKGAELLAKKDRGKDATINLKSGEQKQRKFGEAEIGGIEGLELLEKWKEEQRAKKRAEKGLPEDADVDELLDEEQVEEDDEWEVASMESSDSGDWIRVSDSEGEEDEPVLKRRKTDNDTPGEEDDKENAEVEIQTLSKLATTSILTPADLAKLKELRMEAGVDKAMGNRKRKQQEAQARHMDEGLTAEDIEAPAKLRKTTKEERVAMAKEGKGERDEHKSTQAIRKSKKEAEGKSTTNKEKARKKNFLMTLSKAKNKNRRSLVQTRNILKAHVERSKSGGRRRNGMTKSF